MEAGPALLNLCKPIDFYPAIPYNRVIKRKEGLSYGIQDFLR